MKTTLTLIVTLLSFQSYSQIINFTDNNFKNKILSTYGTFIDTNNDGQIQISEATNVNVLLLSSTSSNPGNITSLGGIEYFVNIVMLTCSYNQLTTVDLSNNTQLSNLHLNNNHITTLNLNSNVNLNYVNLTTNNITSLSITNCPLIHTLYCERNQLTNINTSNNPLLKIFHCTQNQITSLNLTNNVLLETLFCGENQLPSLNLNTNTALKELECRDNNLTNLNVSNNTLLTILICEYNMLPTLNVDNNTLLTVLACGNNQLSNLSINNNLLLTDLLCYNNLLTGINVTNAIALESFYCGNNPITSLNLSNNLNLSGLSCQSTSITTLDLSNNINLFRLDCISNFSLTYINLKNGNNSNISLIYSDMRFLPALTNVCLDNVTSPIRTFIQQQVIHPVTFTSTCNLSLDENNLSQISLFPNPVENEFQINSESRISKIEVYNQNGQLILINTYNNKIDLTEKSAGIYLVKVTDEFGRVHIKKVIKK